MRRFVPRGVRRFMPPFPRLVAERFASAPGGDTVAPMTFHPCPRRGPGSLLAIFATVAGLALLPGLSAAGDGPRPAEGARASDFRAAIGAAVGADLPTALQRLRAIDPRDLEARMATARACMLDRFASPAPARDALQGLPAAPAAVLLAYRRYWQRALLKTASPGEAQSRLARELAALLPGAAKPDGREAPAPAVQAPEPSVEALEPAVEALEPAVEALFKQAGWHVQTGLTRPLHELMAWRSQSMRREQVALPGGTTEVTVFLLDDFASFGWTAYATCDFAHTGGWAEDDGLRAVRASMPPDSEAYRASLLAHESQHTVDYKAYPALAQPDLEYRAKLAELWASRASTGSLLLTFEADMKRERALPHPFADFWVLTRLRERLGVSDLASVDAARVRSAAAALLGEHGAALDRLGAATATTALPD